MRRNEELEWEFPNRLQEAMVDNFVEATDFEDNDICSESAIKSYIKGTHIPNLRTAHAIAEFLGVSVDWLCGEESY